MDEKTKILGKYKYGKFGNHTYGQHYTIDRNKQNYILETDVDELLGDKATKYLIKEIKKQEVKQ